MSSRAACRLERLGFQNVYDYAAGKSAWASAGFPLEGDSATGRAGGVARGDVPTCRPTDRLAHIADSTREWGLCVVVDATGCVLGVVPADALAGDASARAETVAKQPRTMRPSARRAELLEYFARSGRNRAVVTTLDGHLVGVVRREDVTTG
jgi:hypothetical protein